MKLKILTIFTVLAATLLSVSFAPSGLAYAACNDTASKKAVTDSISQTGKNACDDSAITNVIKAIVGILSYVAGVAGVIMIILSGFKYITSGGDSGKIGSAKSTLIYAMVGLAVAALAQIIVHFAINTAEESTKEKPKKKETGSACIIKPTTVSNSPVCRTKLDSQAWL